MGRYNMVLDITQFSAGPIKLIQTGTATRFSIIIMTKLTLLDSKGELFGMCGIFGINLKLTVSACLPA